MQTSTELLKCHDIVEACGTRFIIVEVHKNRPSNPYVAIKERGNGAKYKLGHKHNPRKVGVVSESHYLLSSTAFRDFERLGTGAKKIIRDLLESVVKGDAEAKQRASDLLQHFV